MVEQQFHAAAVVDEGEADSLALERRAQDVSSMSTRNRGMSGKASASS
jgi:hypothetical protein